MQVYFKIIKRFFLGILLVTPIFLAIAQSDTFLAEKDCPLILDKIDAECTRLGPEKCKTALEACEKFYQGKSDEYKGEIGTIQVQKKTLQGQISTLDSKIKSLTSQISKSNLLVKDLNVQIDDTGESINKTVSKIDGVKINLADLIQMQNESDQIMPIEMFLTGKDFSSFFEGVTELEAINDKVQDLLRAIEGLKTNLQQQQDSMVDEKDGLEKAAMISSLQKEQNAKLQKEKQTVLTETKGKETLYQKYLDDTNKKANEIRKKIFELAQVSGGESVTLEQAYAVAKEVERLTGTRAAFLLGLLKQESAIGKNVGQCNCGGSTVCRNPDLHFSAINPSKGQLAAFTQITSELGMDINKAPVSCYIDGGKVQFGGAMGPAQFMPSTWLDSGYKARVEAILKVHPANPWRVKDAFLASGLYLADNGSGSKLQADEISAATAYLCGTRKMTSACIRSGGKTYVYGIMQFASQFQDYIDQGILR
ncbi:MAG: lytic murein transglycosylase [Candidatus Gribaldobacteria bacterium]|nr:lytic murein transglycosylase [Candidatus Gribaldobacteria bacterium]